MFELEKIVNEFFEECDELIEKLEEYKGVTNNAKNN